MDREQVLEKAARDGVPVPHEAAPTPDDSVRAHNRELVDRYRSQLDGASSPPKPVKGAQATPANPT
jgi:hypothetical protein